MPEIEFGQCPICGFERQLHRKYYRYDLRCECHSPKHFEVVWHCENCEPEPPEFTTIDIRTENLKHLLIEE